MNILPERPGRERRLAYGNYIRNMNRRRMNRTYTLSSIDVVGRGIETNRIEILDNCDEKTGILLKDLYKNSTVYFTKEKLLCSICLNDKNDNIIRKLVCNHVFHIDCIEMWLSNNKNCPMCRCILVN